MNAPKLKGSKKARLSMARLAAVQTVYQWLQAGASVKDILSYYDQYYTGLKLDEDEILPPDRDLFANLLEGVQTQFDSLNTMINQHLNKRSEGIETKKDLLILSILYCGVYELMNHQEYDPPLIISEYLHITNSFYDDAEIKLVNGVLDSAKKTLNR